MKLSSWRFFILLLCLLFFQTIAFSLDAPIMVAPAQIDLGRIARQRIFQVSIPVSNEGNKTLRLKLKAKSCTCASVKDTEISIAPREKTVIRAELDGTRFSGSAFLSFYTNSPAIPEYTVEVTGIIVKALRVVPDPLVIEKEQDVKCVFDALLIQNEQYAIESLKAYCSHEAVEVEVTDEGVLAPVLRFHVSDTLRSDWHGYVQISNGKKADDVRLPVTIRVLPEIRFSPKSFVVHLGKNSNEGSFRVETAVPTRLNVVTADKPYLKFEWEKNKLGKQHIVDYSIKTEHLTAPRGLQEGTITISLGPKTMQKSMKIIYLQKEKI